MRFSTPAHIAFTTIVFVIVFFIASSFDFALVVAVSAFWIFSRYPFWPIFLSAFVVFALNLLFEGFDINISFIGDLSVDAYILFVVAVAVYLRSRKGFTGRVIHILRKETKYSIKNILTKLVVSVFVGILLFPMLGGYLVLMSSYVLFSFIMKQFTGKIAIGVSLFILFLSLGALLTSQADLAEELGNYAFLFLIIATFQELVTLAKTRIESTGRKIHLPAIDGSQDMGDHKRQVHHEYTHVKEPVKHSYMPQTGNNKFILPVITGFVIAAIVFFVGYVVIGAGNRISWTTITSLFSSVIPSSKAVPTPTIPILPTEVPTMTPLPTLAVTEVTTEAARMKILVQNGTNITGLAASTSAILKKSGFSQVEVNNAEGDYANWELTVKEKKEYFLPLFKHLLQLSDLRESKEATLPAGFDILIVAGTNK